MIFLEMSAFSSISRLSLCLVIALGVMNSTALGQSIITQTASFSNAATGDQTFNFNQFDPSLGTLTGVTIQMMGITSTGSAIVVNTSSYDFPIGAGAPGYNENLTGGFTNTFTATSSTSGADTVSVSVISNTQTQNNVTAGGSFTTSALSGTQSPNPQNFAVSDIANYIGTGSGTITITLNAVTQANVSATAGTNTAFVGGNASALASGTVNLIYTYTPVPEPSQTAGCMILFALCLLAGRHYFKGRGQENLA